MGDVMFTAWRIWPFVHCITYTVIPAQHRLLWVSCIDLLWNALLAVLARGGKIGEDKEEEAAIALENKKIQELMIENSFFFVDEVIALNTTFTEMREQPQVTVVENNLVTIGNDTIRT